jgi:hypothetical protein
MNCITKSIIFFIQDRLDSIQLDVNVDSSELEA